MNHKFDKPIIYKPKKHIIPDVRIVNVFIKNNRDKILLLKRSKNNVYFPGYYHIVTGKLLKDETFYKALIREVKEEIGIKINKENVIEEDELENCKWDERTYEVKRFFVKIPDEAVIKLNHEHSEFIWADIDEVDFSNSTPQIEECIEVFC